MSKQVDSDDDTEEDEEDTEEDGEVAEEGWNSCMFHLLDRSWKLKENYYSFLLFLNVFITDSTFTITSSLDSLSISFSIDVISFSFYQSPHPSPCFYFLLFPIHNIEAYLI